MGGGGVEFKIWCHDNQPNVTQQKDTEPNNTQHKYIQHNDTQLNSK